MQAAREREEKKKIQHCNVVQTDDVGVCGAGVDAGADAGGVWLFTFSIAKSCPITSHLFPNFTCSSLGLVGSKDLGVISEILVARSIPPNSQRSRR